MFENKGSDVLLTDNAKRDNNKKINKNGDQQKFTRANKISRQVFVYYHLLKCSRALRFQGGDECKLCLGENRSTNSRLWKGRMKTHKQDHRHKSTGFQGDKCQKRNSYCSEALPQFWVAISNAVLDNCLPVKCSTSKGAGTDPFLLLSQSKMKKH